MTAARHRPPIGVLLGPLPSRRGRDSLVFPLRRGRALRGRLIRLSEANTTQGSERGGRNSGQIHNNSCSPGHAAAVHPTGWRCYSTQTKPRCPPSFSERYPSLFALSLRYDVHIYSVFGGWQRYSPSISRIPSKTTEPPSRPPLPPYTCFALQPDLSQLLKHSRS